MSDPDPKIAQKIDRLSARLDDLLTELRHLRAQPALMPWGQWLRHQVRSALGLHPQLGRLEFPPATRPRPIRVPRRYHKPAALKSAPTITVVTPSFQQGRYLERTLKSVLDQNYPRLEYVVQDGGSTDSTRDVMERYRARLARAEMRRDNGQSHAINLGFAGTSGDIMAYLNSDDLLLPGSLNAVAAYFEAHPEVDAVYGHRVVIDSNDNEMGRWVLPPHNAEALKWADYIPQETLFWRRRLWDRVGGIDESFRFAMDWDLLLRFQDAGAKLVRLPRFMGAFRVHHTSKTVTVVSDVGAEEMARLRARCHGREVSGTEVAAAVRPYLWRHTILNRLYELGLLRH
jgi:glycosyltransferase involved in cell wall biosynthesis